MNDFNQELINFIKTSTCSYTTIKEIKRILDTKNYHCLNELKEWHLKTGKYYIIRSDASIIAFNIPKIIDNKFYIGVTHSDTPAFSIKPNPEYYENGYLKINVAPYGGILNYGFMDRPLSIAGRIILKTNNIYTSKIIDVKKSVAIIPSIAIHQNDKANSNLDLNTQVDLMPIISLNKNFSLKKIIKESLNIKEKIIDYDLILYNNEEPQIIHNEFLASPRIDNLTCTYAALKGFLSSKNNAINVLAVFNSEEIGSNTLEGADSNFLIDTLKKICANINLDLPTTLANSFIVSADNTHAAHPNHDELSDHTNTYPLNSGILITKEMNGTTNSITSTIFQHILEKKNLKWHFYTSRNDYATGATLAGASLKHLSIHSLDIALPMLAMHSSTELIGLQDVYHLYEAFKEYYNTNFTFQENKIIF